MRNLQVNIKNQKNQVFRFSDVAPGNLFEWEGEIWFKYRENSKAQHPHSTAISLSDGWEGHIDEDQEVNNISSAVLTVEVE